MSVPRKFGAVIAAAGMSSRMGSFKPLLDIGGETAAARLIRTFQSCGAGKIWIVTGHRAGDLEGSLSGCEGVSFIHNSEYAGTGMFESVCMGLKRAAETYGRVLVTPADVPLFRAETVRILLNSEGNIIIPVCEGRDGHPVLLSSSAARQIIAFHGEGGLHGAMLALRVPLRRVEVADKGIWMDMDTPEDYKRIIEVLPFSECGS